MHGICNIVVGTIVGLAHCDPLMHVFKCKYDYILIIFDLITRRDMGSHISARSGPLSVCAYTCVALYEV